MWQRMAKLLMNMYDELEKIKINAKQTTIIVIDLETGGLNDATNEQDPSIPVGMTGAQSYPVLEITAKFLDGNLSEIKPPQTFVVHQPIDLLMARCSEWSKKQFSDNLFLECAESNTSLSDAESSIVSCINSITSEKCYIMGNSVGLDKAFIQHHMPNLAKKLHYRIIDVSSFKVVFNLLFGDLALFAKKDTHRTEEDATESINELKFYMDHFLKRPSIAVRDSLLSN